MQTDIYAAGPIEPVARISDLVQVYSQASWHPFRVDYIEPLPRGMPFCVDFGAVAANASVARTLVNVLRLDDNQLIQVRFRPIDYVECALWEQQSQGRFALKFAQGRVTVFTGRTDPYWSTSQFFVLGKDRDPYLEVFNRTDYALAQTRIAFWGYRYILLPVPRETPLIQNAVKIPAEGRAA